MLIECLLEVSILFEVILKLILLSVKITKIVSGICRYYEEKKSRQSIESEIKNSYKKGVLYEAKQTNFKRP